ncbi:hypothetical protein D8674_019064 [Pyrus ussuriensis x Pyrus communis]|uniref:Uncharacterized protein n=1 Tax=Pyrus ussuriensis x Pyrus communis TaxID=2448454 RepID=A0A5N5GC56_9ROSA|nr:hypothetical protein D8674_019064 [Pyrus ussuriensis x Pyrus communis]
MIQRLLRFHKYFLAHGVVAHIVGCCCLNDKPFIVGSGHGSGISRPIGPWCNCFWLIVMGCYCSQARIGFGLLSQWDNGSFSSHRSKLVFWFSVFLVPGRSAGLSLVLGCSSTDSSRVGERDQVKKLDSDAKIKFVYFG